MYTPVDSYTYVIDVLQRISMHPAKHAIEPNQWMWKSLFADAPLRSDFGSHYWPAREYSDQLKLERMAPRAERGSHEKEPIYRGPDNPHSA